MEKKIYCLVNALRMNRIRRRRFTAVMIVLSMIVSSSVVWQLHSTGNAMSDELLCGMSEHVHTAECLATELACSEDHEHTQECYNVIFNCDGKEHLHTEQCRSDISADTETAVDWEATLPEKMTDDRRENLAAVAESQLGYTESTKNFIIADDGVTRKGYTRYGDWYGNPYGDWNALFAYFCLYYAGITENELPYGSGCWAWTEELKKAELFSSPEDITVSVGDLVFLDTDSDEKPDRVGIVSEVKDKKTGITFTAIEGDLGDAVDKADYSLADEMLAGFVSMDMLAENNSNMPVQEFRAVTESGITVFASAAENVFPENTVMVVTDISTEDAMKAAAEGVEDNAPILEAVAVDISFFTKDGEPIEPADSADVQVRISLPDDKKLSGDDYRLLHQNDNGEVEHIDKADVSENGASFITDAFSPYIVYSLDKTVKAANETQIYVNGNLVTLNNNQATVDMYVGERITVKVIYSSVAGDTCEITPYTIVDEKTTRWGDDGASNLFKVDEIQKTYVNGHIEWTKVLEARDNCGIGTTTTEINILDNTWSLDNVNHKKLTVNIKDYTPDTIYIKHNDGRIEENNSQPYELKVGESVDIFLYSTNSDAWLWRPDSENSALADITPQNHNEDVGNNLYKKWTTVTGEKEGSGCVNFNGQTDIFFNVVDAYKENTIYYSVNGSAFMENTYTSDTPRLEINVGDTIEVFIIRNAHEYVFSVDDNTNDKYIGRTSDGKDAWDDNYGNGKHKLTAKFEAKNPGECSIFYGQWASESGDNIRVSRLYLQVNPTQQTGTKIKVIDPKNEENNYQTENSAYRLRPNESVTIQASVGPDKYTRYGSLEEYNKAKENNKNDAELRFAQIGNTYISTYARFWGTDKDSAPGSSEVCKSSYITYSMNGDNLVATVTYSANDIKYNANNMHYASFIDNKDDYSTMEHFWIRVEVPMISVYTSIGWKDKDFIHEAFNGQHGDTDGEKYWSNADKKEQEGGSFGEGQYYMVHPGDWIYLSGIGNGEFKNLRKIGGNFDDSTQMKLDRCDNDPPKGDNSGKTNIWKLTMPNTSSGKAYYAVDYVINDISYPFYFMFTNTGIWGWQHYDHADFEIADGGIYEMLSQHYVKPDGTEIKTIRTYDSYVDDVQESWVYDTSGKLVGHYEWRDYSINGSLGGTQFEYTSKYKTDENRNRLPGEPAHELDDNDDKAWMRVNTDSAQFKVDISLTPKSEVTIIKYPDGREEQIMTDAQTLSSYETLIVKNVIVDLDRQSVIDAVNKCPNHSGLDFTVLDEQMVKELRSGNALIEAYKIFKDDHENPLNGNLVGGEFEFELYQYFPYNGEKYDPAIHGSTQKLVDSSAPNVAEGYVYFDRQFYIDLDMSNDESSDFYYFIKEKIPNNPDSSITYSEYIQSVHVNVTPKEINGEPTYDVKVEYLDMYNTTQNDHAVHTYTPADKYHNPISGEQQRAIPAFINIQKTYLLPSTGGGGTTIFYLSGTAIMLTAAAVLVRRRRREEKQP